MNNTTSSIVFVVVLNFAGETGTEGVFSDEIPESYYTIRITAEGYDSTSTGLTMSEDMTTEITPEPDDKQEEENQTNELAIGDDKTSNSLDITTALAA